MPKWMTKFWGEIHLMNLCPHYVLYELNPLYFHLNKYIQKSKQIFSFVVGLFSIQKQMWILWIDLHIYTLGHLILPILFARQHWVELSKNPEELAQFQKHAIMAAVVQNLILITGLLWFQSVIAVQRKSKVSLGSIIQIFFFFSSSKH